MGTSHRFAVLLAAASLAACDASVFDDRPILPDMFDAGAARTADATADAQAQSKQPVMSVDIHRHDAGTARTDAGQLASAAVGSNPSTTLRAGSGGSSAAGTGSGGQAGHAPAADAGSGSADAGAKQAPPPAADGGKSRRCPLLPSEQNESFCYDFEQGLNGPNAGDTYDLWTTPQLPAADQLTLMAETSDPRNHVLQTKPSSTTSEASAALSHSTRAFESATVDFDIWVDDALVDASADVSWFRYVPMDGDYDRVTALVFRRGQALLRSESHRETPLTLPARTTDKPLHVTVRFERHIPCQTEVDLDGTHAGSLTEDSCAPDRNGFVEFGLVMVDRMSGELTARYDNIAWTRQ